MRFWVWFMLEISGYFQCLVSSTLQLAPLYPHGLEQLLRLYLFNKSESLHPKIILNLSVLVSFHDFSSQASIAFARLAIWFSQIPGEVILGGHKCGIPRHFADDFQKLFVQIGRVPSARLSL